MTDPAKGSEPGSGPDHAPRFADDFLEQAIAEAVNRRGAGKSICPSEVARALSDEWRDLMPDIRRVAAAMVARGDLAVLQRGREVDPAKARGPIRLARPRRNTST